MIPDPRGDAAAGLLGSAALGGAESEPETPSGPDLESALAGVEAALGGIDPKIAEEVREHVNAIREIALGADATALAEAPPVPEGEVPEEPKINV